MKTIVKVCILRLIQIQFIYCCYTIILVLISGELGKLLKVYEKEIKTTTSIELLLLYL